MARIEKEIGKRLPLASLFTANTVEKLATEMELDDQSISWDLLVPVKPTGTKPPIFIVNGLDMNVLLFNNIARNMEPDQPVYGFQPRGLNGVDEPFETLEDMAAEYIAALLERDFPDGYALAGYSYGGVVAYEMSRQLQAMGKKVKCWPCLIPTLITKAILKQAYQNTSVRSNVSSLNSFLLRSL
ncbi:thioesterase domain-containing protein [Chitinophaga pinensis]|nr:thioesterase domain-containing protein [Chitinophaga pinensis]